MLAEFRAEYHRQLCEKVISIDTNGVPNNADKHSRISVILAKGILNQIHHPSHHALYDFRPDRYFPVQPGILRRKNLSGLQGTDRFTVLNDSYYNLSWQRSLLYSYWRGK